MSASSPLLVRSCNPTDPAAPGHAVVIVHYLDPTTNTRTFLLGEESSYIERPKVNNTGAPVYEKGQPKQEKYRGFPTGVANTAARKAYIQTNANYLANPTSHLVLRENKSKDPSNARYHKYTLQLPNGIWGFPKGSGPEAESKDIALREFQEEIGYTLDRTRLTFKKCVEVPFWDKEERKQKIRQSVVFHYELRDVAEKDTILDTFRRTKTNVREGELFNVGFFTEADVNSKGKNDFSSLAFSDFGLDHATNVDQTSIPRGGIVIPAPAPPPPQPTVPSAPPVVPTPVRYARGPNARGIGFHSRRVTSAPPPEAPASGAWRRSGRQYADPTSAPPPGPRRKWGGSRKTRKRMTRKRR
jgi:hypothetical protein